MSEFKGWEEVPDEDLGFDGDYIDMNVLEKIYKNVAVGGKWKIIREIIRK